MKTKILFYALLLFLLNACQKDSFINENEIESIEEISSKKKSSDIPDKTYINHRSKGTDSNLTITSGVSDFTISHPGNIRAVDYRVDTKEYRFYDINGHYHATKDFRNWSKWHNIRMPENPRKYPNDIVGMFTTVFNGVQTFTFYRDQTFSVGDGKNMERYQKCRWFNLPSGKSANDIVGATVLRQVYANHAPVFLIWFKDGTYSSSSSINFTNLYNYSFAQNKLIYGITHANFGATDIYRQGQTTGFEVFYY